MLTIETYLDKSPGRGIGLFTTHDLKPGTAYWIRNEIFDKIISPVELDNFPALPQFFIKTYACLESTGNWYLSSDNDRFCNHSDVANTVCEFNEEGMVIRCLTSKEIKAGEEIFCNYTEVCSTCSYGVVFEES